MVDNDRMST